MFAKFEEIIEDHRKRNRQTIIVALVAFFILFLLFNVGFAFWVFQSSSRSKIDALLSWNPTTSQYVFSLIELLMLFWWVWLFLNYKLLQMRMSLVSDHMVNEQEEEQKDKITNWEEIEKSSFLSKRGGSILLLTMSALLFLSSFLSWGRQSIPLILSGGLLIYEIIALIKAKKIEAFVIQLRQVYAEKSVSDQVTSDLPQLRTYLIVGLFIGVCLSLVTNVTFHYSRFDGIFFSLAFCGLSMASALLRGMGKLFIQTVRFADSVRLSRNEI